MISLISCMYFMYVSKQHAFMGCILIEAVTDN